jgi:hypothetical protein
VLGHLWASRRWRYVSSIPSVRGTAPATPVGKHAEVEHDQVDDHEDEDQARRTAPRLRKTGD